MSEENGVTVAQVNPGGITDVNLAKSMIGDMFAQTQTPAPADQAPQVTPQVTPQVAPQVAPPAAPPATPPATPPAPFDPEALRTRYSGQPAPAPAVPDATPVVPETPPGVDATKPESKQQVFTWGKLRSEHDQFRREAAERAERIKEIEAEKLRLAEEKALIEAERQKIIQERDTYVEKLGKVNLAESPEFQKRYGEKLDDIQAKLAADLVKFSGITQEDAINEAYNLLTADMRHLNEALKDNPQLLGRVMTRAEEAAALYQQRDEELKNWRETSAALGIQQAREQVVKSTESRRQWADVALELAKQSGHPIFSAQDGELREQAAQIEQAVHGFVQTATEEELTRAAVEGFANPFLYDAFNRVVEENRALRDRLEGGYRASTPPLFPSPGVTPTPPPPPQQANVQVVNPSDGPAALAQAAINQALQNVFRRG